MIQVVTAGLAHGPVLFYLWLSSPPTDTDKGL
jgi:hypothetical protein